MERSAYMRTFLLLLSITAAYCGDGSIRFATKGKTIYLYFKGWGLKASYSVLYRVYEDGDALLASCSQPDSPQPPDAYDIRCEGMFMGGKQTIFWYPAFTIGSISQMGHYRVDGLKSGIITGQENFQLIFCAHGTDPDKPQTLGPSERMADVSGVELCRLNVTLGNGITLKVYRHYDSSPVLDSSSSLEPLVEDLKGRLQVDLDSSRLILHEMSTERFTCTIWREDQCSTYTEAEGSYFRRVFIHQGNNLTLPCISNKQPVNTVEWNTPSHGYIFPQEVTRPQEQMYMLNGGQSGNYSLVILAVSKEHSGLYTCKIRHSYERLTTISLSVCPLALPLDVMFSHGESVSVTLNDTDDIGSWRVYWYCKEDLEPDEKLVYSNDGFVQMLGWFRGRVSVNRDNHTLTISKLTAEDSAVFTWRRLSFDNHCTEGSIRLVYRDPLGVGAPFYWAYIPVLGAVLLGLVAAVVWMKMRSRRGELTPGPQSREGQQNGDKDL